MPQWAYGVMSISEWLSGPYPPDIQGFQSIPYKYPNEELVSDLHTFNISTAINHCGII
jgi:hypothetical protein